MSKRRWAASALALSLGSCAEHEPESLQEELSSIALRLTLPDGAQLSTISYQVVGSLATRAGTIDVQNSSVLRFRIGDLPVGPGYTINLSATTSRGATCAGSAPFAVIDNQVTTLGITLVCREGTVTEVDTNGDVAVNVAVNTGSAVTCPVVTGISLLPSETRVGTPVDIEGFATSAADSVRWSAPSGSFASASSARTSFGCEVAGDVALTYSVEKAGCPTSQYAAVVSCTGGASAPNLLWNEIESNGGTPDDWVELYNAGTEAVNLSGWTFRDNDDTRGYAVPAGTSVAPGAYLVLEGFGFGLGSPDSGGLYDAAGQLVLSHSWGPHAPTTYGRCPNVVGELVTTSASTKGAPNDCTPVVRINEVESSGGTPDDWVELYNAGFNTADLSGYQLLDNDDTHVYTLPAGTLLAPGSYFVLDTAVFGFGLGAGDSVRLRAPGGAVVDTYTWTSHAATTYGRCPTGSGNFATRRSPPRARPTCAAWACASTRSRAAAVSPATGSSSTTAARPAWT